MPFCKLRGRKKGLLRLKSDKNKLKSMKRNEFKKTPGPRLKSLDLKL